MNFEVSRPKKSVIVFKIGEKKIDALNSPELKAEFLALCQSGVKFLIVDLSQVEYCDSSGLSALLFCRRRMNENKGEVMLVGVRDKILNLMRIARIDSIFNFSGSVEEALSKIKG
ncbi:anti-anti-sigma factor [Candidatus Thermokryptus mobilis]|uniref:Anti-sigma factor antagonist n=1 Tax=Candidatus Thermokryptus mobilis TaxID=1643428 RepID=A0A0S4MZR4_9BACT|nr:STAS domain-containing protein [Candidatus Thermokryptus mobilis]CUU03963.1 anti-anti-sigma factor [Candidatus Thermokryptus mobilis]